MPITDKFFAINIRKYLALGDDHEGSLQADAVRTPVAVYG